MLRRPEGPPASRARPCTVHAGNVLSGLAAAAAAALAIACASTAATAPTGGGGGDTTGTLAVTVTTPSGVTPSVIVNGPSGYVHTVTATSTLTGLVPGTYTITAATVSSADPIVGTPYSGAVTGSPATIVAKATETASVSYTQRATHGLLWVTNASGLSAFTSAQLAASGSPTPAVRVTVDGPTTAFVIDAAGGAWVTPGLSDSLLYYTQAQLLAGGSPTAAVRFDGGQANEVIAFALDAQGDLWAAGQYPSSLVEYAPGALTASGSHTPATTIGPAYGSLARPFALAFDAKNDLWAATTSDSTIVGYTPSQLSTGGALVPFSGIDNTTGASTIIAMAFDPAGNLWAASASGPISQFAASDLTSLGSPSPAVTLTLQNNGTPGGIAFDDSGDLWVSDAGNNLLAMYTPSQLTASGTPTPARVIRANGSSIVFPGTIEFSPHAANLPIH